MVCRRDDLKGLSVNFMLLAYLEWGSGFSLKIYNLLMCESFAFSQPLLPQGVNISLLRSVLLTSNQQPSRLQWYWVESWVSVARENRTTLINNFMPIPITVTFKKYFLAIPYLFVSWTDLNSRIGDTSRCNYSYFTCQFQFSLWTTLEILTC